MLDSYGRNINNMRISVTQQCNLKCFYCHKEGENGADGRGDSDNYMTPGEIEKIAEIGSRAGIEKLKITGGEPLLRDDILDIVRGCANHMKEISMTTNGVLLKRFAEPLKDAGLKRVNISLDAHDTETFRRITGTGFYHDVKLGVEAAFKAGLSPVKLNMVVLKGINDGLISAGMEFASDTGAILQLIEFESSMEGTESNLFKTYHCRLAGLEDRLKRDATQIYERAMHRRRKYIVPTEDNGGVEVEIVRGMHNSEFCSNCTRLRVTSSGKLKPCLLRGDNYIDIAQPMKNGAGDDELLELFRKAIRLKEPYWRV